MKIEASFALQFPSFVMYITILEEKIFLLQTSTLTKKR